jgi:RND family efflux transporter MFP subunit
MAVLLGSLIGSASPCQAEPVEAISAPSTDIMLSFVMTGVVVEVQVKEGDPVEAGAVLAVLDDKTERIRVEELKAQAEDMTRIEAAEAELAQKRVDLDQLVSAQTQGAATDWEVAHARLNVRIAELSVQALKLEREQNRRRYEQAVSQVERMRLVSPIAGRVETVSIKSGESAKALLPMIQVIQTDPLWIDVPVPLADAEKVEVGQRARVVFPGSAAGEEAEGRVIHISSVVDAASDTLEVRVEVPNPHSRPAGERVHVAFEGSSRGADQADEPKLDTHAKNMAE